jgi:dipeptidyl-peptidase-4
MILIACNSNQIFRHSFTADYYLYNIVRNWKLFDFQVQEPTFSPNGKKIAYAKENNLYVYDLAAKSTTQITTDGKKMPINGITDFMKKNCFCKSIWLEKTAKVSLYSFWRKSGSGVLYVNV